MLNLERLSTLASFPETPLTLDEVRELAVLAREAASELRHRREFCSMNDRQLSHYSWDEYLFGWLDESERLAIGAEPL